MKNRLVRLLLMVILSAEAFLIESAFGDPGSLTAEVLAQLAKARQQRIEEIAKERARLLITLQKQEKLVDHLNSWASSETDRRLQLWPMIRGTDSRYLESVWNRRQQLLSRLTHFREKSHPVILNGKALNALLLTCGPSAVSRQRRKVPTLNDNNEANAAHQLLEELESLTLPPSILGEVNFQQGLTSYKLTGRLGDGTALDLNWPLVLRKPLFDEARKSIEVFRGEAIRQLKNGDAISPSTASHLMGAVDQLRSRVYREGTRVIQSTGDYRKYWPYKQAEQHMDALANGVVRFVTATKLEHVQKTPFDGRTVEELLAYMQSNSMQFAQAGPNGDLAYGKLFDLMMRYFLDSALLDQVVSNERKELEQLKERDRYLQQVSDSLGEKDGETLLPALMHAGEIYLRFGKD